MKALAPCYHLHKPALTVVIIVASCLCSSDLASSHRSHKTFLQKGKSTIHLITCQLSAIDFTESRNGSIFFPRVSSFSFRSIVFTISWTSSIIGMFFNPHKLLCCVYHCETETWSWENTKNISLKAWKSDCRRYKSVLFASLPPCASKQNNRIDALPETFWERNDNVIVYRSQWGNFPFARPLSRRSWVVNNPLVYSKNRISVLLPHSGTAQSILANVKNGGGMHMM